MGYRKRSEIKDRSVLMAQGKIDENWSFSALLYSLLKNNLRTQNLKSAKQLRTESIYDDDFSDFLFHLPSYTRRPFGILIW